MLTKVRCNACAFIMLTVNIYTAFQNNERIFSTQVYNKRTVI